MVAAGAFGDYHSSEIKFVFGGPKLSGVGEESLSRDFMRYWLGFGRSAPVQLACRLFSSSWPMIRFCSPVYWSVPRYSSRVMPVGEI